jgi:GxxExxY protein
VDTDPQTEAIIAAAIEVHTILGPGFLESIYQEALCRELELRGIPFERQKAIDVTYKGYRIKGQRLDLVVQGEVVVEIKAHPTPHEHVIAQILSYLRASRLGKGLIINFGLPRLVDGVRRVSL